jgi:hypothetical protein
MHRSRKDQLEDAESTHMAVHRVFPGTGNTRNGKYQEKYPSCAASHEPYSVPATVSSVMLLYVELRRVCDAETFELQLNL